MNIEKIKEVIKEKEQSYDFNDNVLNFITDDELSSVESLDELKQLLESANDGAEITYVSHHSTNVQIIYYHNAIDYLKENDPSLQNSIEMAKDYGYELEAINSELLASLLATEKNHDDYYEFIDQVINELSKKIQIENDNK